ncbi:MAG: glycosyl transferase, group 2 family protein [Deltaproteobacteria bacterium]|nr:glycosyl transferase, group 2 family protein [Deltaproteobacteria bacterium]
MNTKLPITVLVAAKNEERNLGRCLSTLSPAERIIVIDSHSQDRTAKLAEENGAEVVQFNYTGGYPKKRQWALTALDIATPWIFLLDADEAVPIPLWEEIKAALNRPNGVDAYLITKGFHFLTRRFRFGGFSHSAVLLFRKGKAQFERLIEETADGLDMEIHERLIVHGTVGKLKTPLIHEDFKGLEAYIARHNHYSSWEARVRYFFLSGEWRNHETLSPKFFGPLQERRRFLKMIAMRTPFEPLLWFLYHYLFRLGFLEGKSGFIASQIRANYIAQARAKLYEIHHQKDYSGAKAC